MNEEQRLTLAVVSRVAGYPDRTFHEEMSEMILTIQEEPVREETGRRLVVALEELYSIPLRELQEIYVTTFDLKEDTGLYLTAHELGDSRDRGASLILLQHIISDAGYELKDGELADYMPALYELVAVAPENVHVKALQRRLAVATKRIADHFPLKHPFKPFFRILVSDVFGEPSLEDIQRLEHKREKADLKDMPYPILYGMDGMARTDTNLSGINMCKGMGG